MKNKKIQQPLKYPGGKYYLQKHIHELMPGKPLVRIVGMAGGLGEFWNMPYQGISEVINDLNGDLTNFYSVLKDDILFEEFKRQVALMPFSQVEWEYIPETLKFMKDYRLGAVIDVDRAVMFFILVRQSLAGRCKNFSALTKTRTRRGMSAEVSAWLSAVDGLNEVHERLKRVVILNEDACVLMKREDHKDTFMYFDPPYLHSTRTTIDEYGEFEWDEKKHIQFLDLANEMESMVMISGYSSDLYNDKLKDWNKYVIDVKNSASHKKKKDTKQEIIWTNY